MPEADVEEIEALINAPQLPERRDRMSALVAESLVVRPEIARAMANGMTDREVCEFLGISRVQLNRYMNKSDFKVLLEVECRRLIRHLSHRALKSEKYLQLATSLGLLVDKMRVLNHEPESVPREAVTAIIQNLTIGIFGRGGGSDREALDGERQRDDSRTIQIIPECAEPEPAADVGSGGVQSGLEGQPELDRMFREICDDER